MSVVYDVCYTYWLYYLRLSYIMRHLTLYMLIHPGGSGSYGMYSSQPPAAPGYYNTGAPPTIPTAPVHNRYVGYDAINNTVISYTTPPPPAPPAHSQNTVPAPGVYANTNMLSNNTNMINTSSNVNIYNPNTDIIDVVSVDAKSSALM